MIDRMTLIVFIFRLLPRYSCSSRAGRLEANAEREPAEAPGRIGHTYEFDDVDGTKIHFDAELSGNQDNNPGAEGVEPPDFGQYSGLAVEVGNTPIFAGKIFEAGPVASQDIGLDKLEVVEIGQQVDGDLEDEVS